MNKKMGISLVVLVVTIMVMSIITGVILIRVNASDVKAKQISFIEELGEIHEACQIYYIRNGKYPVIEEASYTKEQILQLVGEDSTLLQEEFTLNKDTSQNFYEIDLYQVHRSKGTRGYGEDNRDIYVLNESATCVYYLKGIAADNTKYFSVSSKLDGSNRKNQINLYSEINIRHSAEAIKVQKNTENWTNSLTLTITTPLLPDEELYSVIGNIKTRILEENAFAAMINSNIVNNDTINNANGKMYIQKEKNNEIICVTIVDISNVDLEPPEFLEEPLVSSTGQNNNIMLDFINDEQSGIKNVYYIEYSSGMASDYIIEHGTVANKNIVTVSSSVQTLGIVAVDNAGNISEIKIINL